MKQRIEVRYDTNGTTCNDTWWASRSSVTMGTDGRTAIALTDGRDEELKPVVSAQYSKAYRVVRYQADDPKPA